MDPDGKHERRIELPPMRPPPPVACLSPDGRSLAFRTSGDDFQPVVCVRALDGTGCGTRFELKEAAGFVGAVLIWTNRSEVCRPPSMV